MDDDQQFCLRWNNHQSTLVSVFDTLLEKGMHVDCTLAAEGQTLKAHKVVLSACSPYFESVLSQQYDKHPIIILKDVKYAELRAMMDYMYRGEVNISQDQLAALLKAAESLQIKGLSDNKPSRPPSRPAPPAHPPRPQSPAIQPRDGSIDSREGSTSPSRRRKKARRLSVEVGPLPAALPANDLHNNGDDAHCKEEAKEGVSDLTIDEDADDTSGMGNNDVVRNFQWHMERSQDEIMNSNDSIRDSQVVPNTHAPLNVANAGRPVTRAYLTSLKHNLCSSSSLNVAKVQFKKRSQRKKKYPSFHMTMRSNNNHEHSVAKIKSIKQSKKLQYVVKKANLRRSARGAQKIMKRRLNQNRADSPVTVKSEDQAEPVPADADPKWEPPRKAFACGLCLCKRYKYRRNLLRHEKYECRKGPQFCCDRCGRRYSQKKTMLQHIQSKHDLPFIPVH